jgi:hypothetical protein
LIAAKGDGLAAFVIVRTSTKRSFVLAVQALL